MSAIEHRYFIERDTDDQLRIRKIEGIRYTKIVKVNRSIRELQYRVNVPVQDWDNAAKTEKQAIEFYLNKCFKQITYAAFKLECAERDYEAAGTFKKQWNEKQNQPQPQPK